ncbi:MAG: TGS domain-containing protein, partial [Acidimicrobiia bacterium]
ALTRIGGVLIQLVEIPGLIEGANADRGGGRALLGVLRNADAVVYCHEAIAPLDSLVVVRTEVVTAGIELPAVLALTKADEVAPERIDELRRSVDLEVVAVSILDDASLDELRQAIWRLTGLIRVWLHHDGEVDPRPQPMHAGATVADVADRVHHELGATAPGARIWGVSARFDGQRVGRDHVVQDGDTVEVLR